MWLLPCVFQERLEAEADALRRQLRHEMSVRKACEKWMKSELRSRVGGGRVGGSFTESHQGGPSGYHQCRLVRVVQEWS
jgi:hypothetical protein